MVDSKKTNKQINTLAKEYRATKSELTLIKLNRLVGKYFLNKTYLGLTDNITLNDRHIVTCDTFTKVILDIDRLNLEKYSFVQIIAQTFRQLLIKYYQQNARFVPFVASADNSLTCNNYFNDIELDEMEKKIIIENYLTNLNKSRSQLVEKEQDMLFNKKNIPL